MYFYLLNTNPLFKFGYHVTSRSEKNSIKEAKTNSFKSFYDMRYKTTCILNLNVDTFAWH